MNNFKNYLGMALGAALISPMAMASTADLVVTQVSNGGNTQFEIDFLNDANATALQFELKLGAGVKIETTNCLASLPSSHTGACNAANGVLKVAIFSATNAPLSSGSIGSIIVSGPASGLKAEVSGLLVGSADGQKIGSNAILDGASSLKENFEK